MCHLFVYATNTIFQLLFMCAQDGDDSSSESSSVVKGAGGPPKEIDWAKCFSSVHQSLTNVMYFV